MNTVEIINVLENKGINKILLTKEDVGVEYTFETEQQVLDLFNQLDVKGKVITFSPPNTIADIGTLGKFVHQYLLDGEELFISKFELGE